MLFPQTPVAALAVAHACLALGQLQTAPVHFSRYLTTELADVRQRSHRWPYQGHGTGFRFLLFAPERRLLFLRVLFLRALERRAGLGRHRRRILRHMLP